MFFLSPELQDAFSRNAAEQSRPGEAGAAGAARGRQERRSAGVAAAPMAPLAGLTLATASARRGYENGRASAAARPVISWQFHGSGTQKSGRGEAANAPKGTVLAVSPRADPDRQSASCRRRFCRRRFAGWRGADDRFDHPVATSVITAT